ncbi:MAG: hypothetical protein EPO09_19835 [Aquabacterium sp.]|uniref:hypothetical protein n=1 Tax=Aquabacterium sp. TaxID=1872578 RepID=UPI0012066756|nr:hypothetical protein [Aquabacterium sp.]TAK86259.1 MAG: hypothetical protein EPO09_19835 [Aquabacterium sp.]
MKLAYPLSESIRVAMLEAACPPAFMSHSLAAMSTPPIQRCIALQELVKLVDRLGRSKSDVFALRCRNGTESVQFSKPGERLLDLLFLLAADIQLGSRGRRLDPRLHLAFEGAFLYQIPLSLGRIQFDCLIRCEPCKWAAILSGMLDRMRSLMKGKAFVHGLARYRARDTTFMKNLSGYFQKLVAAHPTSEVLRQELYWPTPQGDFDQRGAAAQVHLAFTRWFEMLRGIYGCAFVGHAWQLQRDTDRYYLHLLLVVDGPSKAELLALMECARTVWREVAGPGAFVVDCKRAGVQLKFRGFSKGGAGLDLAAELANAVAFFAFADALISYDFDDLPPTRGYKSLPKTRSYQCAPVQI